MIRYFSNVDFFALNMSDHKYIIDLHTHSIFSHDGGLSETDYKRILENNVLDYIAITDHNEVAFAMEMQKRFGERIIVGEEIMSQQGEIIGLFLKEKVEPQLTLEQTFQEIHKQRGFVYIPHPFETLRKGLHYDEIVDHITDIDIIEVFNARAWGRGKALTAQTLAARYKKPGAASSDAHTIRGIGTAYSIVKEKVTRENLPHILLDAKLEKNYALFFAYLAPFYNKWRKKMKW